MLCVPALYVCVCALSLLLIALPPLQHLVGFAAEIAAYHSSQSPIAADAAQRKKLAKQQQKHQQQQQQDTNGYEAAPSHTDNPATDAAGAGAGRSERGHGSRKWTSTPDFVGGGSGSSGVDGSSGSSACQLHPYQLEGLNWLYHKAQVGHNVILGGVLFCRGLVGWVGGWVRYANQQGSQGCSLLPVSAAVCCECVLSWLSFILMLLLYCCRSRTFPRPFFPALFFCCS